MKTKQDLIELREQLQEDLITFWSDFPIDQGVIDKCCQLVVDRMQPLIEKMEKKKRKK